MGDEGAQIKVSATRASFAKSALVLRVRADALPAQVTLDAAALAEQTTEAALVASGAAGYVYDAARKTLIVRVPPRAKTDFELRLTK